MSRTCTIESPGECPYRSGTFEVGECQHDDSMDEDCKSGDIFPKNCPLEKS